MNETSLTKAVQLYWIIPRCFQWKSVGYLHFHKEDFSQHQKLGEEYRLSELISFTFDWTYKILNEKFPNEIIQDSSGVVGFA